MRLECAPALVAVHFLLLSVGPGYFPVRLTRKSFSKKWSIIVMDLLSFKKLGLGAEKLCDSFL